MVTIAVCSPAILGWATFIVSFTPFGLANTTSRFTSKSTAGTLGAGSDLRKREVFKNYAARNKHTQRAAGKSDSFMNRRPRLTGKENTCHEDRYNQQSGTDFVWSMARR